MGFCVKIRALAFASVLLYNTVLSGEYLSHMVLPLFLYRKRGPDY